jgi:hypothetical protein
VPRQSPFIIELTPAERAALEFTSRRYSAPYRDVVRARIVLLAGDRQENTEIARRLDLPVQIVSKWRKRFFDAPLVWTTFLGPEDHHLNQVCVLAELSALGPTADRAYKSPDSCVAPTQKSTAHRRTDL